MTEKQSGRSFAQIDPHKELVKILRGVSGRYGLFDIFRDFVTMAACAISNAVDLKHYEEREALYMKTVKKYTSEEACEIAKGLAIVTMALETGPQDFLGTAFMQLDLGDAWKGQFFTPFEIAKLMAMVTMGDAKSIIEREGFITVSDCCVGAGSMIIAAAEVLKSQGINYQRHMHTIAGDIDSTAVYMAYIQASLLHMPAVIYHGNSLTVEVWSEWRTPAHVLGFWDSKLRRRNQRTGTENHQVHMIEAGNVADSVSDIEGEEINTIESGPDYIDLTKASSSSAVNLRAEQIGFDF
jgi:hypothetical protein